MNNFKEFKFGDDGRRSLLKGAKTLSSAVSVTLGPGGMNVVIEQENGPPLVTKDGVTVAKSVNLRDKWENLGAQIIKEAASRACEIAGDGTTTATILTHAMFDSGMKLLSSGHSYAEMKRGMSDASTQVQQALIEMGTPVRETSELVSVGTISANGESLIGEVIARAFEEVGRDGVITVEEAKGFETYLEVTEGTEIDRGYISPYFVTDSEKMIAVLENPLVLVSNKKITTAKEIVPLLESVYMAKRPLVIIADDVEGEALQTLYLNKSKSIIQVCVIRPPEFGEGRVHALEDLAALLGANFTPDVDLKNTKIDDLGSCKKIVINRTKTIFVNPSSNSEKISKRVESIKQIEKDPSITQGERELLQRRKKRLAGSVAVIRVGGSTEQEMKERKDRVDDALSAVYAAVSGGILPGGGTSLIHASKRLRSRGEGSYRAGFDVVVDSCFVPLMTIASNCGLNGETIVEKARRQKLGYGFNASTHQWCNLIEEGVIDPVNVVLSSLEHATSAAIMLLSVGAAIVSDNENNENEEVKNV